MFPSTDFFKPCRALSKVNINFCQKGNKNNGGHWARFRDKAAIDENGFLKLFLF